MRVRFPRGQGNHGNRGNRGNLWGPEKHEAIIDYGDESDIVALRYRAGALQSLAAEVGFEVTRCVVEPVDEFPMDAIYLEGVKG